jgi:hypothetical protein
MLKFNSILNENIERYCMQIQFNSTILLRFNWIEFKFKKMGCKYGGEQIENLFLNMVLKK